MPDEPSIIHERDKDFKSLYANNLQFEASLWDLKLIFGSLDQSTSPTFVRQHTAVSIPWMQAKLTAYFLLVNLTFHQNRVGVVPIPADITPPRPNSDDPSLDENGRKVIAYLAWVHDQFFSDHPYVPPELAANLQEE